MMKVIDQQNSKLQTPTRFFSLLLWFVAVVDAVDEMR